MNICGSSKSNISHTQKTQIKIYQLVSSKPGIKNCRNSCSLFIQVAFNKLILLPCREKYVSDQIVISGPHVIPGVFNSKQTSFLAQTDTTEIACLLLAASQWQNVNKIHPSRGKSKTLQSHPCTLPTVISHLPSGSGWGQLLWWSGPKKQTWRQVLTWRVGLRSSDSICQSTLWQILSM